MDLETIPAAPTEPAPAPAPPTEPPSAIKLFTESEVQQRLDDQLSQIAEPIRREKERLAGIRLQFAVRLAPCFTGHTPENIAQKSFALADLMLQTGL